MTASIYPYKKCKAGVQDVSRRAPVGPELVALVITVMLSFRGDETLRPLSDS